MSFWLTCKPDPQLSFWRQIIGGAFCSHYIYGLVTGFFLGQAFIIGLFIAEKLGVLRP